MQTFTELKLFLFISFLPRKVQHEIIFCLNSENQEITYCIHAPPLLIAYRHLQPEGDPLVLPKGSLSHLT